MNTTQPNREQEAVNMLSLERYYKNPVLFGEDPLAGIVAVEAMGAKAIRIFRRVPNGVPPVQVRDVPFKPFLLIQDVKCVEGFSSIERRIPLEGDAFYSTLVEVEDWTTLQSLIRFLKKRTGAGPGDPRGPYLVITDRVTQFLLRSGKTLFKGMAYSDIHRLQLDIETRCTPGFEFPNAEREGDRIIMVSLSDSTGWETCLSGHRMDERTLLEQLIQTIRLRDPDVIEGHNLFKFDLPYIETRARRHGVELNLGRDGSPMRGRASRFSAGERTIPYTKYTIYGRHIVDTLHLSMLYDLSARDMKTYGLKDVARHFGIASSTRTYVEGDHITELFDSDPEKLADYALDDVRETRAIADLLGESYFLQTQIFPLTYQNTLVRGNASRIDLLFLREYLRQRHSIPQCPEGRAFEGAYTAMKVQGIVKDVLHCDIRSLYPSIMLSFQIYPETDVLKVSLNLLKDLRTFRLEAKKEARRASTPAWRRSAQALQSIFKILINSFYGYLGFSNGHFADFNAASKVTAIGRSIIKFMEEWLENRGVRVIEIDTDGIYFTLPSGSHGIEEEKALIDRLNSELPPGIEAEIDGRYAAMLSYKIKNYALLDHRGRLVIKGSSLRSRGLEPFQRRFMEQLFTHLLRGEGNKIRELYQHGVDDIRHHRWTPADFCKRETLKDSLALYQEKRAQKKRGKAALYELALKSGRDYQPGDAISYYVTGSNKKVKIFEAAKRADQWDPKAPDENIPFYLSRLDDLYKKFEPFIIEAGGPSFAALQDTQPHLFEHAR